MRARIYLAKHLLFAVATTDHLNLSHITNNVFTYLRMAKISELLFAD